MTNALSVSAKKKIQAGGYSKLKEVVKKILLAGRARAEKLVDEEKARTYWEMGKEIEAHIQSEKKSEKDRNLYGDEVVKDLSKDLHLSDTLIYDSLVFSRTCEIFPTWGKLGWSKCRCLIYVEDETQRNLLVKAAEKLTVEELRRQIAETKPKRRKRLVTKKAAQKFIPKRGELSAYRVGSDGELELGFSTGVSLPQALAGCKEGEFVRLEAGEKFKKISGATKGDIYTYKGKVERVVDGDTLWVRINLGFRDFFIRQKLRLRGIDAPELSSAAGRRAKKFVEEKIAAATEIIVTTTKPDKYDRYLSDVWVGGANLNQLLLESGLAAIKTDYSEDDWDENNWGRY